MNRVKIIGLWASNSLTRLPNLTIGERLREYVNDIVFRSVLLSLDLAFWTTRLRQRIFAMFGLKSGSFEDELEKAMRGMMKSSVGVEVGATAFGG